MKIIKTILILVIVSFIIVAGFNYYENNIKNNVNGGSSLPDTKILGNKNDLVSFSINPGDSVSGNINIVGSVKNGYFFEGNILINVLDYNKKIILNGNGNAITDWATTERVGFNTAIDFTYLPKGPAYIEIRNDNPGYPKEGINKSILIPVIIK